MLCLNDVRIITKRNWIVESIVSVFIKITDSILDPHMTTWEPNNHVLNHSCALCREFTVRHFCWIVSKIAARLELIHKNNFLLRRRNQKGYNLGSSIGEGMLKSNYFSREDQVNIFDNEWKSKFPEVSIVACV